MKKLKLIVEDLEVQSFATLNENVPRGTVRAHATEFGGSCDPGPSCGPETCGDLRCILETQNMNLCGGGGTGGCTATTCPPGSGLSCVGCTTYDYTVNPAHDSCGWCASFESQAPERCRCI